jgi:hypothetical protein
MATAIDSAKAVPGRQKPSPDPANPDLALTGQSGQSTASYLGSAADWPPPFCTHHAQPKTGLLLRRHMA